MLKQSAKLKKIALCSGLMAVSTFAAAEDIQYGIAVPEVNAQTYVLSLIHISFGICGILLSMWLIRLFFKIKVDEEAANFEKESGHDKEALKSMSLKVTNTNPVSYTHLDVYKRQLTKYENLPLKI